MTKPKTKGSKTLIVRIPVDLHDMLKRLANEMNVTITYVIVNYLKYLKTKHYRDRKDHTLSFHNASAVAQKKTDFKLDQEFEEVEDDLA
jgi:hypothetical protein